MAVASEVAARDGADIHVAVASWAAHAHTKAVGSRSGVEAGFAIRPNVAGGGAAVGVGKGIARAGGPTAIIATAHCGAVAAGKTESTERCGIRPAVCDTAVTAAGSGIAVADGYAADGAGQALAVGDGHSVTVA